MLGQSVAKQYTYAKNIVQDFFSPDFVDGNDECYSSGVHQGVRYRDSVTGGYSVTPNFFIRGFVPEYKDDGQYGDPYFSKKGENTEPIKPGEDMWDKRNRHFHALVGRVFQPTGTPHCLILALERDVVDKSKEGDKDDYRAIRKIVDDAKCEVFYVWPHEIWEDEDLRKNRGWKAVEEYRGC